MAKHKWFSRNLTKAKRERLRRFFDNAAYELSSGVHTWHTCPCGRNPTRTGKCWECNFDDVLDVLGREEPDEPTPYDGSNFEGTMDDCPDLVGAGVDEPQPDLGEPFDIDKVGNLVDRGGYVVAREHGIARVVGSLAPSILPRIKDCLNACRRMADPQAEIERLRAVCRSASSCIKLAQGGLVKAIDWEDLIVGLDEAAPPWKEDE